MDELQELYREVILDHNRKPRNFGELPGANHVIEAVNPLCGDKLTLYVNVADDYHVPRTAKVAAAWAHRLGENVTATVGMHYARTRDAYHYVDLNLPASPAFRLENEGGRGVFVPASTRIERSRR